MVDDGRFIDESEPHFGDRYIPICVEGAVNLDIYRMGKYQFCMECGNKEECKEFSKYNAPLSIVLSRA